MILSYLPPTYVVDKTDGYNGNNNLFRIVMWKKAPHFAAVLAQELREWGLRALIFAASFIAYTAVIVLTGFSGAKLVIFAPILFAGILAWRLPFIRRYMEIQGHAVECVAADILYGYPLDASLPHEAEMLLHPSYDGIFSGYSARKRLDMLTKALPKARRWFGRKRRYLERAKDAVK